VFYKSLFLSVFLCVKRKARPSLFRMQKLYKLKDGIGLASPELLTNNSMVHHKGRVRGEIKKCFIKNIPFSNLDSPNQATTIHVNLCEKDNTIEIFIKKTIFVYADRRNRCVQVQFQQKYIQTVEEKN